jgi:hypothetical protein
MSVAMCPFTDPCSTARLCFGQLVALLLAGVLFTSALYANIDYVSARLERRLKPMKTTERITVDGVLDETSWNGTEAATDFTQTEP